MKDLTLIDTQDGLRAFAASLSRAPAVAIDTEFVRESTYYPKLCLIQVAAGEEIAGVDCLAGMDLAPLYEVLYEPSRPWILHSARQDLEVFFNAAGRLPGRLIDTQVAAALVGFTPQLSLGDLLAETIGVELDKSHARTDWTRRPIAEAHLRYALDDVRHLEAVWEHLRGRLAELDRLAWFEEDAGRVLGTPLVTDAETLWGRLRGIARLPEEAQRAALALVHWREGEAQRLNRPRRWILSDEVLVEIARARPATRAALAAIPEMPKRLAARAGATILEALAGAAHHEAPGPPGRRAEGADKSLVKALQAEVGVRARELRLHSEVLATRRDLTAVALGDTPDYLAGGWRAAALASTLARPRGD